MPTRHPSTRPRRPANPAALDSIRRAALDQSPVRGLTHTFYKYPARFSPAFARACIETFSKPGDTVLDPFMGGGTTIVEALVAGRHNLIRCSVAYDMPSKAVELRW